MPEDQDLRRFAESLVRLVRDPAIATCDRFLSRGYTGPGSERWRRCAEDAHCRDALSALIPDIVDQVLGAMLNSVDNGDMPLAWQRGDRSFVPLEDLGRGEMVGWFMGSPGWRDRFSEERFYDSEGNPHLSSSDDSLDGSGLSHLP
jgi:hypothetical protein